jgi:hypothetical protein
MNGSPTGQHEAIVEEHRQLQRRLEDEFSPCPKWDKHELSDSQIKDIAEMAALRAVEIARENFYKDVGKAVVSKWLIAIGVFTVATYAWFRNKGIL